MTTQEQIAKVLDRAADRAEIAEYAAATSKQVWYLAGLMAGKNVEPEDVGLGLIHTHATLTTHSASRLIDQLSGALETREHQTQVDEFAIQTQTNEVCAARDAADLKVEARFPAEWRSANALSGADRREAKRLLRRRYEADQT